MDGRAAFAAGGFLAGAAAVAVACAVTLSNASALADVPGRAADVDVVRVTPASPRASAPAPTPRATAVAAPVAPVVPAPGATAEVVPAPEPEDVAAPQHPSSPPPAPPAPRVGLSEQQVVAEAVRSGSWDSARSWGEQRGWTQEKIDRWIAQLQQRFLKDQLGDDPGQDAQRNASSATGDGLRLSLETTAPVTEKVDVAGSTGKNENHPQTPAKNAGSPSDRGNSSSHGWKRDQSPQPPHGD